MINDAGRMSGNRMISVAILNRYQIFHSRAIFDQPITLLAAPCLMLADID